MSTPVDVIFGMSYGGNLLHYRKADSCGKNHFLPTANLHGTCFGKHISGCNLQSPLPHLTAPGASQSQNQAAGRGCAELPGWQKQSLSACPSTAPQCLTSCPNLGAFTRCQPALGCSQQNRPAPFQQYDANCGDKHKGIRDDAHNTRMWLPLSCLPIPTPPYRLCAGE